MVQHLNQLNLQDQLGGGEIYTSFVSRALSGLGVVGRLFVSPKARFWQSLDLGGIQTVPLHSIEQLEADSPSKAALVTHTALDANAARRLASRRYLAGFLHMPLYERFPSGLPYYRRVWGVSRHVMASAAYRGLTNVYQEPLLGVADLQVRGTRESPRSRSPYDWDSRKIRDRLLGRIEGLMPSLFEAPNHIYSKQAGTQTIAIVSRLTPIKQFPLMFSILSPVIREFPSIRLEIFGSGGYASVRDLRRALQPCAGQVRFWGRQSDVEAIYRGVDYVLSGLPEKEALGLNLIEAQQVGTPVLAVNKPPFIETIVNGVTGLLFADPREDGGASFRQILTRVSEGNPRLAPRHAEAHLAQFSLPAFQSRLERAMMDLIA